MASCINGITGIPCVTILFSVLVIEICKEFSNENRYMSVMPTEGKRTAILLHFSVKLYDFSVSSNNLRIYTSPISDKVIFCSDLFWGNSIIVVTVVLLSPQLAELPLLYFSP